MTNPWVQIVQVVAPLVATLLGVAAPSPFQPEELLR